MASQQHDADPEHSSRAPSPAASQNPRPQRVLACVMCQQRKVKCNRKFPCNNCIRLGVTCVPATLNPRRRRRRFPERELLDRLRGYEALLRQHNVRFDSQFQDAVDDAETSPQVDTAMYSDGEAPETTASEAARSPATGPEHEKMSEAKIFWNVIKKGFRARDDDDDSSGFDETELRQSAHREIWGRSQGNAGSLFFRGPYKTLANISSLHPGPVQIFRLWQIYLDNVDPLLKITHTPTLQARIVEATSDISGIDATLEALMFSIYCVAIHSMPPSDCETIFSSSKEDLLATYHPACEQALLNCGFLRTNERDCLAAYFLYMISLGQSLDPLALYSMMGVAVRLCQTMQINNEMPSAKLPPLEAEMRRRLWWAIVLFDARISELASRSPTVMDPTWDCKIPLNANDSEFRAEMKEPPTVQARSSEAIFAVVRSDLGNAMRYMEYYLALSNPALKHMARDVRRTSTSSDFAELDALEKMVNEKYLQYCDPENALHFMTIWAAKGFIAKCRLIKYFSKYSASPSTDQTEALRDGALTDSLAILESDTKIMTSPLTKGYRWLFHLYFPLPAYIHITQEVARRIGGERATRAWEAMSANYEGRIAYVNSKDRYMFNTFSGGILQAWDACEARSREAGEPQPVPKLVIQIRSHLAEAVAPPNAERESVESVEGDGQPASVSVPVGIDSFQTSLPMDSCTPGVSEPLYGIGGQGTFASAAEPIFPSPNLAAMNFGMGNVGNWPPIPWAWGTRPSWG